MKKIKFAILLIYFSVFLLVTLTTIFLVVSAFRKNFELYFKEVQRPRTELNITEQDINQIVDLLRKFKFIE